jgi:hypothetical protein
MSLASTRPNRSSMTLSLSSISASVPRGRYALTGIGIPHQVPIWLGEIDILSCG